MPKKAPPVFQHFIIPDNYGEIDGNFKAKCKYCSAEISASSKATSNLGLKINVGIKGIMTKFSLNLHFVISFSYVCLLARLNPLVIKYSIVIDVFIYKLPVLIFLNKRFI